MLQASFYMLPPNAFCLNQENMTAKARTVLITGANRGIGAAMEGAFHSKGWQVISCMRKLTDQARPTEPGQRLSIRLEMDITHQAQIDQVAKFLNENNVTLDVLINNAGIFPEPTDMSFRNLDLNWFHEAMNVNLVGTIRVTKTLLPLLAKSQNPRIVNLSSGAGSISQRSGRRYCYGASKAALNHFTRGLATELKPEGITVVALSPGWVKTDMGGSEADLEPESVGTSIEQTVQSLTLRQTGRFLDRLGNTGTYSW